MAAGSGCPLRGAVGLSLASAHAACGRRAAARPRWQPGSPAPAPATKPRTHLSATGQQPLPLTATGSLARGQLPVMAAAQTQLAPSPSRQMAPCSTYLFCPDRNGCSWQRRPPAPPSGHEAEGRGLLGSWGRGRRCQAALAPVKAAQEPAKRSLCPARRGGSGVLSSHPHSLSGKGVTGETFG